VIKFKSNKQNNKTPFKGYVNRSS